MTMKQQAMKPRLWLIKAGIWACGNQNYANAHLGDTANDAYSAWCRSMK